MTTVVFLVVSVEVTTKEHGVTCVSLIQNGHWSISKKMTVLGAALASVVQAGHGVGPDGQGMCCPSSNYSSSSHPLLLFQQTAGTPRSKGMRTLTQSFVVLGISHG